MWKPALEVRILSHLRAGNYVESACALAGVHRETLARRLKRGRTILEAVIDEDAPVDDPAGDVAFLLAVEQAMAEAEEKLLRVIDQASEGYEVVIHTQVVDRMGEVHDLVERRREFSWQAAAWRLERMYPRRYGRRKVEEEPDEAPAGVNVQIFVPDNQRSRPVLDGDSRLPGDPAPQRAADALPGDTG